jgi:hypothetical protein
VATASDIWVRRAGLALGLVLALGAVLSWRIPSGTAALPAQARFTAVAPGELTVAPVGNFMLARGARGDGVLVLRDIARGPVSVELRARPSTRDLDRLLWVEISDQGRVMFRGRLTRLRRWTPVGVLRVRELRRLAVRAWLPPAARAQAAGALVDVTVELRAAVADG